MGNDYFLLSPSMWKFVFSMYGGGPAIRLVVDKKIIE
jgi:hypothetical protein